MARVPSGSLMMQPIASVHHVLQAWVTRRRRLVHHIHLRRSSEMMSNFCSASHAFQEFNPP